MKFQKYPRWTFYPRWSEIPHWVENLLKIFIKHKDSIDSISVHKTSNEVLARIRADLENIGYIVEGGVKEKTIYRPVYFGEYGMPDLQYQIDSYHVKDKIALEIEAGRSTRGNAIYRDIIQTSLVVGVEYFVIAVPQRYPFEVKGKKIEDKTYEMCKSIFDAIYGSERLRLPFKGILLIGY